MLHDDILIILTKGLRKAVHALYQSRDLDVNTHIEGIKIRIMNVTTNQSRKNLKDIIPVSTRGKMAFYPLDLHVHE